jgi:hypothetical protein
VSDEPEIILSLEFDTQTAYTDMIAPETFRWEIRVFAIFDRPHLGIEEQIVDVGEVFRLISRKAARNDCHPPP